VQDEQRDQYNTIDPAINQSINQSINRGFIKRIHAKPLMRWCASKRGKQQSSDCVWKSGLTEPSAETPSSVHWRRFYFQLTRVHSALEHSGRYALQIYLLTYLLTIQW